MTDKMIIAKEDLRKAFLARQGLVHNKEWLSVPIAVDNITAVQIDTIAVVARSHHLVLRHRVANYAPEHLWRALKERKLLEYFVHGNSFISIEDYPYLKHCMQRFPSFGYAWLSRAIPKYQRVMNEVLQRIREEGPLTSRDFKDPEHRSGGWWNWKPAKSALELLWWMGQIVVVDRRNFERVYDITERAIPSEYLDQKADEEDVWRYFLKRAIDCLAIATIKDILGYLNFHIYCLDKKQSEKNTLEEKVRILKQEDVVVEIEVEDDPKPHYALSGSLPLLAKIQGNKELGNRAWFLSPFDNVVWDRNRVRRLFDADMRLEAYFPASKRQFGYYAMPILWNDRIVGRLDPRVDRKSETMVLENLELNINYDEERIAVAAICQELTDFMAFNGCSRVMIRKAKPAEAKNLLF